MSQVASAVEVLKTSWGLLRHGRSVGTASFGNWPEAVSVFRRANRFRIAWRFSRRSMITAVDRAVRLALRDEMFSLLRVQSGECIDLSKLRRFIEPLLVYESVLRRANVGLCPYPPTLTEDPGEHLTTDEAACVLAVERVIRQRVTGEAS